MGGGGNLAAAQRCRVGRALDGEQPSAPPRRLGLAAGGFLTLVALALYAFLMSPAFRLERIVLSGSQHLTPERVAAATELERGDLSWRHPAATVRARLLAAEPWLEDAEVRWQRPGLLVVAAKERQPVALIPYYNLFAVLDAQGRILELATLAEYRLPIITGVPVPRGLLGDKVEHPHLAGALTVARLMPPALLPDLGEVRVEASGDLTLLFTGPLTAKLGRADGLAEKLMALAGVFADARRERMNIELSSAGRPVLVPPR